MPYKYNPFTSQLDFYQSGSSSLGEKYVRTTRFAQISSGTSGTVTLPAESQVVLDDFGGTVDAVISQVSGGKPTFETAKTIGGEVIATTFDSLGNWTLTGTPVSYPVAIIYRVRQMFNDFDSTSSDIIGVPTNDNIDYISDLDGGSAISVFTNDQVIDGGNA